jgi:hypothetical protein
LTLRFIGIVLAVVLVACQHAVSHSAAGPSVAPSQLSAFIVSPPPDAQILNGTAVIQGTRLSQHWYGPEGGVVDFQPLTGTVTWPHSVMASGHSVRFQVATSIAPTRAQIRQFPGPLGRDGSPTGSGSLTDCALHSRTRSSCKMETDRELRVRLQNVAQSEHLVLYIEWFVPVSMRPKASSSDPVVSVSWGFTIVV